MVAIVDVCLASRLPLVIPLFLPLKLLVSPPGVAVRLRLLPVSFAVERGATLSLAIYPLSLSLVVKLIVIRLLPGQVSPVQLVVACIGVLILLVAVRAVDEVDAVAPRTRRRVRDARAEGIELAGESSRERGAPLRCRSSSSISSSFRKRSRSLRLLLSRNAAISCATTSRISAGISASSSSWARIC